MSRGSARLEVERLGPLPLLNHLLERLNLERLLDRSHPRLTLRSPVSHAQALGVLLRSILVEREPVYRQAETVEGFAPAAFGVAQQGALGDEPIGRALDRLFAANRGALLTELVVSLGEIFGVKFSGFHSETTSVRLAGQHAAARGRSIRGKRAPWIIYSHSKDHRPDLKRLLLALTTTQDGGLPVRSCCEAGNASDSRTPEATWDALCRPAGGPDLLYVPDSTICGGKAMDHIDRRRGRFVTLMPRPRREDTRFQQWLQEHEIASASLRQRPHPRRRAGPRDVWRPWRSDLPSRAGWPILWVHSKLLALKQAARREECLARAKQDLARLVRYLKPHRPRAAHRLRGRVDRILERHCVSAYFATRW